MLYYLPIEPLDERYTEQWYRWFPAEFDRQGVDYRVLDGRGLLNNEIKTGTFLDVNSTLFYKATQLQQIAHLFHVGLVQDGDVFFVADIEFWGIESIRYLAVLNKVDVKIYGFCHAGSYTREDFMEPCAPFACLYEQAWGAVFDLIFVGSAYHRKALIERRGLPADRVVSTGNPYVIAEATGSRPLLPKKRKVVHTNRPDPEKRPDMTLDLFVHLKEKRPDVSFVLSTGRKQWGRGALRARALELQGRGVLTILEDITKQRYFRLLETAAVMTGNSIEENFGYCVLEAMIFDVIPVVPKGLSHSELVQNDDRCLFASAGEQAEKVLAALDKPFSVTQYAKPYDQSLARIVRLMGGTR